MPALKLGYTRACKEAQGRPNTVCKNFLKTKTKKYIKILFSYPYRHSPRGYEPCIGPYVDGASAGSAFWQTLTVDTTSPVA